MATTQTGYSISIKALDEASAQIKRINDALKELAANDNKAGAATDESAQRSKRHLDVLHKGVGEFGKNVGETLLEVTKKFAGLESKIGTTIGAIGKSFDLKGAALGLGVAAGAAEKVATSMSDAAKSTRDLGEFARRLGVDVPKLQRALGTGTTLGIPRETTAQTLEGLQKVQIDTMKGKNPDLKTLFKREGIEFDPSKVDPVDFLMGPNGILKKLLKKYGEGTKERGLLNEAFEATGTPKDFLRADPKELDEAIKFARENVHTFSKEYQELAKQNAKATDELTTKWYSFKDAVTEAIGKTLLPYLTTAAEKVTGIIGSVEKFTDEHPGAATGATAIVGGLGAAAIAKFFGGIGSKLGLPGAGAVAGLGSILLKISRVGAILAAVTAIMQAARDAGIITGDMDKDSWNPAWGPKENSDAFEKRTGIVAWINGVLGKVFGSSGKGAGSSAPGAGGAFSDSFTKGGTLNKGMFEAISRSEGTMTSKGIDYNLIHGGGHADLVNMSLTDAAAIARSVNDGVGGFQIISGNIMNYAKVHGLDPNSTKFTPDMQQKIAQFVYDQQGSGAWHGFNAHPEELQKFRDAKKPGGTSNFTNGQYHDPPLSTWAPKPDANGIIPVPKAPEGTFLPIPKPLMNDDNGTRTLDGTPEKQSSNDSSHRVVVEFNNMPPQSRVNMADSFGDAQLNIKTRYSMPAYA